MSERKSTKSRFPPLSLLALSILLSLASPVIADDYYGPAAVKYAEAYVNTLTDCGISYAPPVSGGDCAHFVSHCLEAGGLSNKGSSYSTTWLENPGYIVSTLQLRKWFQDTGVASQVYSIAELEPGDVILYIPTPSGTNHATLYIGSLQVASHTSDGIFQYTHFGTPEFWRINGEKAFSNGDTVEILNSNPSGLTVRDVPAGNPIGKKIDGDQGVVLEDNPIAEILPSDGKVYIWWKIKWNGGQIGWSAQNYPGGDYYLNKVAQSTPNADFTATPRSGQSPLTVQFTDQSNGGPNTWLWDFGDQSPADQTRNPTHTYSKPGEYRVRLAVSNSAGGDVEEKVSFITVTSPVQTPNADFTATPRSGQSPLTVQFTDQSNGGPNTWLWDFGDGTISTERNPTHIYVSEGVYCVTLTTSNVFGSDSKEMMNYIQIARSAQPSLVITPQNQNIPLGSTTDFILSINSLPSGLAGYNLSFTLSNTTIGEIIDFSLPEWADLNLSSSRVGDSVWFGGLDLTQCIEAGSTNVHLGTVTVRGDALGSSAIVMTVTDMDADGGESIGPSSVEGQVSVYQPVKANFSVDNSTGGVPLIVHSTDLSEGNPISWQWNFGSGFNSTEKNPDHAYSLPGQYTVILTVVNSYDQDTVVKTSIITVKEPVLPFPGYVGNPLDLDGDGCYEDINGNSRRDFDDVVVLFKHMDWIKQNPSVGIDPYDFNKNGRLDFDDIVQLFLGVG